jgi:hypothetical protein
MGLLDRLFRRAKDSASEVASRGQEMVAEHGGQVTSGVSRAADFVDDKTGGRFEGALDKVEDATKSAVDRLDGDGPAEGQAPPPSA